jgi:hypothetical protein
MGYGISAMVGQRGGFGFREGFYFIRGFLFFRGFLLFFRGEYPENSGGETADPAGAGSGGA